MLRDDGAAGLRADGTELWANLGGLVLSVAGSSLLRSDEPVRIMLSDGGEIAARYDDIEVRSNRLVGTATVYAAWATFRVVDVFAWVAGGLSLRREVTVCGTDNPSAGFASAFTWTPRPAAEPSWFLPGCVYDRNRYAPEYGIGARIQATNAVREDRLSMPFAAWHDPATGGVAGLFHLDATGETVTEDDLAELVVSAGLGFGAFGDLGAGQLGFVYPGSEGAVSYPPMWTARIGNSQADSPVNPFPLTDQAYPSGWARRYHPVRDGFTHRYELITMVESAASFTEFVQVMWRAAESLRPPRLRRTDLAAVRRSSVDLLASLVRRDAGAIGIPTWIDVFTGQPGKQQDTFSIGFVGRNLEVAYVLLRIGGDEGHGDWVDLAREIIEFWVRQGNGGLCPVEWDRGRGDWADDTVFLRDQSEARTAVLSAVRWLGDRASATWLDWCESYGRWLESHVNDDGSLYRSFRLDGTPVDRSVNDGIHAAAFLSRLHVITRRSGYLAVAERIAEFYWTNFHAVGIFVGGTLDNPNCYDREAASLAMEAYLALCEVTGSPRWRDAAQVAADFCETWIVGWDIPMRAANAGEHAFFDGAAWSAGLGLITLGFSAVDTYLARHVGDFARLAELTGDEHYREVARLLLHNTKQMVQSADEYGYAAPGFQIEHWSIGRGRGYGLNSGWLPWVATSHILSTWAVDDL